MGYTHYIQNKPALTDEQWAALTADCIKLFVKTKIPLAGGEGVLGTKPILNSRVIMFNGVGPDAHETAIVRKEATSNVFCKTARKPYDAVVVTFYKLVRWHAHGTQLRSDGGYKVFHS